MRGGAGRGGSKRGGAKLPSLNRTINSNQVSKDNIGVKICKIFWRDDFHDDQIVRDAVVQPVMSTSSFLNFFLLTEGY